MRAVPVESGVGVFEADDVIFEIRAVGVRDVVQIHVQFVPAFGALREASVFQHSPDFGCFLEVLNPVAEGWGEAAPEGAGEGGVAAVEDGELFDVFVPVFDAAVLSGLLGLSFGGDEDFEGVFFHGGFGH